jgi:glycosyltransferase involved in cell wall biosynthesis
MLTRWNVQKAARVIVASEATRQDLCHFYPVDPRKIRVTPLAAASAFRPASEEQCQTARARYNLPRRFVLALGDRRPHKNLKTLLKAFAEIAPNTDADLVLVGKTDVCGPDTMTPLIHQLGLSARVLCTGYVAETDLPALYTCADVVACPSLVEGSGLSLLEAMACGTAVVASHTSSLPEVVGDAGVLVCPHDARTLSGAILSILQNPAYRRELQRRSLARAARFSWRFTASLTFQVYHTVMSSQWSPMSAYQSAMVHPGTEC